MHREDGTHCPGKSVTILEGAWCAPPVDGGGERVVLVDSTHAARSLYDQRAMVDRGPTKEVDQVVEGVNK